MRHALLALLVAMPAVADDFSDLHGLSVGVQRVVSRLDGDTAKFSVRYAVRSAVGGPATSAHGLGMPGRGLVSAAVLVAEGRRHELALTEKAHASARWTAIHDVLPGRSPQRMVLLEDSARGALELALAMPPASTGTLEVEISAPTCYHRDARYVIVPTEWVPQLPAAQRVSDGEAVQVSLACEEHAAAPAWMKFPARALAARPPGSPRVGTRAGRLALDDTQIMKFELNLAGRLSEIPADLATVILVDASRSMTAESIEAQRRTIAAYLRATPHGRVQVIAYAREARALLPAWLATSQAVPAVERALETLRFANGSRVEEGLREAGRWLDKIGGTRRVVILTDEKLSLRTEREVTGAIPQDTLVHVVALGGEGFTRDDAARLARLAERTKGLSVRGGTPDARGKLDATLLARPITLDRFVVDAPGWEEIDIDREACAHVASGDATTIAEGGACTWWGRSAGTIGLVSIEGLLWNERIRRVVSADASRSLELVRELSVMEVLEEDLQELALRAARAVNAVWSLYAEWGGADGYEQADGWGFGLTGIACTSQCRGFGMTPRIAIANPHDAPDLEATLQDIVATACKPAQAVDVVVETTFDEIVDVDVQAPPPLRACIETSLWNAWLVMPGAPAHAVTRLAVKPS